MRETLGAGLLVGDHDDGHAQRFVDFAQQVHDFVAGGAVEIAGRLIGKQDRRPVDQSAGQATLAAARRRKVRWDDA